MNEKCKQELMARQMKMINESRFECLRKYGDSVLNAKTSPLKGTMGGE